MISVYDMIIASRDDNKKPLSSMDFASETMSKS